MPTGRSLPLMMMIIILSMTVVGGMSMSTIIINEPNRSYGQEGGTISSNTTTTTAAGNQSSIGDFDSFTEAIPIKGSLLSGSILHLIDLTPGSVVKDGDAHILLKAPCDDNGNSKVTLMAGGKPNFKSVKLAPSINNGTLDGNPIPLSIVGYSCLYQQIYQLAQLI
jgi:hypothetical protein